jgi:hypothetical protein
MSANYAHCHSERSEESRRPFPFVSLRVRVTLEAPERLRILDRLGVNNEC